MRLKLDNILLILLALLQFVAPLVHAHSSQSFPQFGLHVPSLEIYSVSHQQSIPAFQTIDYLVSLDDAIVSISAGIENQQDNNSDDLSSALYFPPHPFFVSPTLVSYNIIAFELGLNYSGVGGATKPDMVNKNVIVSIIEKSNDPDVAKASSIMHWAACMEKTNDNYMKTDTFARYPPEKQDKLREEFHTKVESFRTRALELLSQRLIDMEDADDSGLQESSPTPANSSATEKGSNRSAKEPPLSSPATEKSQTPSPD